MCYCELDLPSVTWESWPIARKQHQCCECGSPIDPGEKYFQIKGIWDGDYEIFRQCVTCKGVWDKAINSAAFDCICFGDLWETAGAEFEI